MSTPKPTPALSPLEHVFPGESEMARRMREMDWSATDLGPIEGWSPSLRTCVRTCLDCAFPIVLWWGPTLAILYNDEYRPMLGPAKHRAALGQPGAIVWAEIWDVIGPMLSQVMTLGRATRSRDLLLHIDRGYLEEAYFSFSYSPIYAEDGTVGGIFCPVIETTDKIIGERRLRTLRDLAATCKGAKNEDLAYTSAANVLGANPYDVPFALIYRVDSSAHLATLVATAGIEPETAAAPRRISLDDDGSGSGLWAVHAVAHSGKAVVVSDVGSRFDSLPTGAWSMPPQSAIVLPVPLPGQELPRAILIAAISPMRALDTDHRTFFELVATQIASALADARALDEERQRAEALAELDRAKTMFFSNISHEFRTPLTLMLGPLEHILTHDAARMPIETADTLKMVDRNCRRLLKLVNTLLDFSRIEAGRVHANYEPTDLAAFTSELASVFRSAIEKAGLQLVVECPPLPEPVYVDRDMWEKIVLNLLSNAFKFTFAGEIMVGLRAVGSSVMLTVSDTGVGIPVAELPKLFQRFHRVKHARSRTHEGTGIGLALVQELARLHGGDIRVESREGRGTTFTVIIPIGTAHLPAERIEAARADATTGITASTFVDEAIGWLPAGAGASPDDIATFDDPADPAADGIDVDVAIAPTGLPEVSRSRVLLVDDNTDMREYVRRLLARHYDVETAADGKAALERVRANPPALVLADVMMPELDGLGLLAEIRRDERTKALPVILLSARAGEESEIEGLQAGADAYLIKPFSARELLARVASQLELARVRHEAEQALTLRGQQYETLLNQAPMGVYLVDADFRIREANPIARVVFGDIPGGIIGRDFEEVVRRVWPKDFADEIVRIFRHTLRTGEPFVAPESAEIRIDRGVVEHYEWRLDRTTLLDGGFGVVCYFRDISVQVEARQAIAKSAEALQQANQIKDEFLAMLSHELRTPLNAILGWSHMLREGTLKDEARERALESIERNAEVQSQLVNDLLDVSRIVSGKFVMERNPVDLVAVVSEAIDAVRLTASAKQIDLQINIAPNAHILTTGDATRLRQIVSNLLSNAVKFTPSGGTVRISLTTDRTTAEIVVSDNGQGIAPAFLPYVFDRFRQAETSIGETHGGLGLGLALVRHFTEAHGGTVTARSDGPGRGATFAVRLPIVGHDHPVTEGCYTMPS